MGFVKLSQGSFQDMPKMLSIKKKKKNKDVKLEAYT